MEITQKRGLGLLMIVLIMAVGVYVVGMPLLAFIFALMVLIFSLSQY
jgi:hypothetical protein